MSSLPEVLILGAGAAGLSCAHHLAEAQVDAEIVEGRSRIGGRVFSQPLDGGGAAELGAEFLHGMPPNLLRQIMARRLSFYDVHDAHLVLSPQEKMRSLPDFWDQLSQITDKLSARKAETVADYLRRQKRPLPLFRSYVEGFYAADLDKIGVDDLARAEHEPEQSWHGRDLFRPYPDYSSFLKHLFQWQTVHLAQEVTDIEWNADRVSLHTRGGRSFQARRLVITVPLSVLKARRIRFAPEIPELDQALEHLHMGHVQRLVFEFDVQIWEKLSREPVSFLHHLDSEKSFPTWWTQAPRHAPFLVGWQGGPKAEAMAQWPSSKVHAEALQSLARLCGTTVAVLQRHLVHVHAHNWSTDSFTLGAYSYPGPNGEAQARRLQKPFAKTLFFAGEATQDGSLRGTVTGAVLSGERAAKQVVASL